MQVRLITRTVGVSDWDSGWDREIAVGVVVRRVASHGSLVPVPVVVLVVVVVAVVAWVVAISLLLHDYATCSPLRWLSSYHLTWALFIFSSTRLYRM